MTFPEEWAFIQFALAECFVKSSEGTDLGCLDNAIYHLQNCSQVRHPIRASEIRKMCVRPQTLAFRWCLTGV